MKRIGIITFQKCDNFGADLQAYALGAKLRALGYDAENIDYLFYKHPRHMKGKGEKPIFRLSLVNRAKELLFPILAAIKNFKRRGVVSARHAKFNYWTDRYLKCGVEYRSVASLYADPPDYDVYIVGSDQVWNPRIGSNIKPYFLDFAPENARCVSYASSIGANEIPSDVFYAYRKFLRRFSAIGVREKGAADIVKAMSLGVEVKHVVDPTLLLTAKEWSTVAEPVAVYGEQKDYLLLYDLIQSEETALLAKKIASEKDLNIIRIGDGAYGPGEFISLFAKASFVVTNSFHGTAFSLIYRKDFYSVIPRGMLNASRIESILKVVGAESRLIRSSDVIGFGSPTLVEWTDITSKLELVRADSIDFLRRAVEGPDLRVETKLPIGCYAVWNKDAKVRAASTSGGVFRILAESILSKNGIVYGAAFTKDFYRVEHIAAETIAALDPLMKSKYVWSNPFQAYKEAIAALKDGREVLFTGTPCQIAALKSLAKGCDEKLITMDIVCHGTPRPEIFESYAKELEGRYGGKIIRYEFRDKSAGWNFPRVRVSFSNGRTCRRILKNDPYYLAFGVNASFRSGCFTCPFVGLERIADFTIADCWRVASSHPEWDDNRGTSLVLVNTSKAQRIWHELQKGGKMSGGRYDLALAQLRNWPLQQRARKPCVYEAFNKTFDETGSFSAAVRLLLSRKVILKTSLIYWVKRLGWFYFKHHQ